MEGSEQFPHSTSGPRVMCEPLNWLTNHRKAFTVVFGVLYVLSIFNLGILIDLDYWCYSSRIISMRSEFYREGDLWVIGVNL